MSKKAKKIEKKHFSIIPNKSPRIQKYANFERVKSMLTR